MNLVPIPQPLVSVSLSCCTDCFLVIVYKNSGKRIENMDKVLGTFLPEFSQKQGKHW